MRFEIRPDLGKILDWIMEAWVLWVLLALVAALADWRNLIYGTAVYLAICLVLGSVRTLPPRER